MARTSALARRATANSMTCRGLAATTVVISSVSVALGGAPASAADQSPASAPLRVVVPPPTRVLAAETAPATYTIQAGDTISAVAARFGLRTADVLAWNGLGWSTLIHPGQIIVLAAPGSAPSAEPAAAPAAPSPAPAAATHTVASGDTLWAIARAAGIPLSELLAANGLVRGSIIYPGQTLVVPGAAPASVPPTPSPSPAPAAAAPAASTLDLDAEQAANARIIIEVGRSLGVSDRGIAIALSTAMVESWLRNLDWGDRDSLGLFQQRPSTGWGTAAEVRDPYRAAAAFFGGASDPNGTRTRGLLDIAGWESLEFGAAAQAVQRSAHPERYGPWEQSAYAWLAALG